MEDIIFDIPMIFETDSVIDTNELLSVSFDGINYLFRESTSNNEEISYIFIN